MSKDTIYRQSVIDYLNELLDGRFQSHEEAIIEGIRDNIRCFLPSAQPDLQSTCNQLATDCVSRQAAIDAIAETVVRGESLGYGLARDIVYDLPSVQPEPSEITDEQAILHLQSTGWMQNHDREMYESGLREQLADDSGSYDSLIPCGDTISRQAAIDALENMSANYGAAGRREWHPHVNECMSEIRCLPSAQTEHKWIPVTLETLPNPNSVVVVCGKKGTWDYGTYRGWYGDINSWWWKKNTIKHVYWWMYKTDALPDPYRGEKKNE